ncbi:hypothetical protein BGZ63DRAFT_466852 [Mariannaea sp. PMI_226]|nr:hypothetical protein BGZ63DRAFT_466852 [Mariannaea sp. PMI_226]
MGDFMSTQKRELPLLVNPKTSAGRVYIVTGANAGLGFEAAQHLVAAQAAKVILAVRNPTLGQEAAAKIEAQTGRTGVAEVWQLDMASYDSIRAFAKRAQSLDRIDGLIENAGVILFQRSESEGHLTTVTVNLIGTLLLAILMLPKISTEAKRTGTTAHLSLVTSVAAFQSDEDWNLIKDDPIRKMDTEVEPIVKNYRNTKLILAIAGRMLAKLVPLDQSNVVINLVCPGFCSTDLNKNAPLAIRERSAKSKAEYGRSPDHGSRTLLYAAVAGPESHGKLTASCEIADDQIPSWMTDAHGQETAQQVWDILVKELDSIEPGAVKAALSV